MPSPNKIEAPDLLIINLKEPIPDISNAEEGTFRVSRHQESVHSVSDICNPDECLLILDDAFPSITTKDTNDIEIQEVEHM